MKKEKQKNKKDWNKIWLIILLILLLLEIVLIPCLVYAEVKKILPIVGFLIAPTLCAIIILILSRICIKDYQRKVLKMSKN